MIWKHGKLPKQAKNHENINIDKLGYHSNKFCTIKDSIIKFYFKPQIVYKY